MSARTKARERMATDGRMAWRSGLVRRADNRTVLSWLRERGSLTARLQRACAEFAVHPEREGFLRAGRDEAALLGLRRSQHAWVRDVSLICDGRVAVAAHSILARHPRAPIDRVFRGLGRRSLGSVLFTNHRIRRGMHAYARIDRRHPLFPAGHAGSAWARRAVYWCDGKPLLVTEVFIAGALGWG